MTETRFFVFGTLASGSMPLAKIHEFIVATHPARAQGSAFRLQAGFPIFSDQGQDTIEGLVVVLKNNDLLVNLLDQFHGFDRFQPEKSLHHKKEIQISTDSGTETVLAYTVNMAKLPKTAKLIEGGDWQTMMKENPPLAASLTERQKAYIQRLGSTSGREIIPIDLGLYRELMKLEIIVDKGRRLALSKLGNEVFRYLG